MRDENINDGGVGGERDKKSKGTKKGAEIIKT